MGEVQIKPENIIRKNSTPSPSSPGRGELVLVDFGAAKIATPTALAKTATKIGSAEYVAIEQIQGKPIFASDIYSLGVTCIHLLTNISPFDLFDNHNGEWVWRDYLHDNDVDDHLGTILDKMIQQYVKHRYQNVEQILADLNGNQVLIQTPVIPNNQNQENQSVKPQISGLQTFNFETVKVRLEYTSAWGTKTAIVKQEKYKGSAQFYQEKLGQNVGLEMVYIPGGSFIMGSPPQELARSDNETQHLVTLKPFFMGKYPITQAQWKAVAQMPKIALDLKANPSSFKGNDRPVEKASWDQAIEFCQRLSKYTGKIYTLPSGAQWEYACRAVTTYQLPLTNEQLAIKEWNEEYHQPFYFGENISPDLVNYNGNYAYGDAQKGQYRQQTTKVGQFPPNNFGLFDMHGNVWEWCLDNYQKDYNQCPQDGSAYINNSDNNTRIVRGGSWCNDPNYCRSAYRINYDPRVNYFNIGFRVVSRTP